MNHTESGINTCAISMFRNVGDGDYIAARMASQAALLPQFLWSSQQAIEKYLKCILLLNRIPAQKVNHSLSKALELIATSKKLDLNLKVSTREFIDRLDTYGTDRYATYPSFGTSTMLVNLDRAVWELRRFCTLDPKPHVVQLTNGKIAPRIYLEGGFLERIIEDRSLPVRKFLLWNNAYFGMSKRRTIRLRSWFLATNPPLSHYPELVFELKKYIKVPKQAEHIYTNLKME